MIANHQGKYFYGDSYGNPLSSYDHLRSVLRDVELTRMVWNRMQFDENTCGLFCVYFAKRVFAIKKTPRVLNDYNLLSVMQKYL